jgi:hypothetical protein
MILANRINKNLVCFSSLILLFFFFSNPYTIAEGSLLSDVISRVIQGTNNGQFNSHGFNNSINHHPLFHLNLNPLHHFGNSKGLIGHENDFHKNFTHDKGHKTRRHHLKE